MGLTRSEQDTQLAELYARIPRIPDCDGRCWTSCGPVEMSDRERQRIRAAGTRITPYQKAMTSPERFWCDALTGDKRCAVYELRPLVCLLPGAWIYTAEGPKRIEEVFAGDTVYGADGKLHRVIATASRYYTGTVVNVRHTGTHVPCWSTDDHQWLAARQKDKRKAPAPEWRPARELTAKRKAQAGDYLCFPSAFEDRVPLETLDVRELVKGRGEGERLFPFTGGGKPVRGIVQDIPVRIPVDEEFLFMLGIYLAEGSGSIQAATFTMHPDEVSILDRIAKYLASLGITSQSRGVSRSAYLTVSSALFGRLMMNLCGKGAAEKRLHPALFARLSHRQLWSVYQAWDVGDGRKCLREREMSTTTISERLAVQMTFAAQANGLFPRTYASRPSDRNGVNYDVHLFPSNWRDCKPGFGTKNMADGQYVYTPTAGTDGEAQYRSGQESARYYEGPVFDIQVEGAESFVTSSGIVHNCRLWGAVEGMPCVYGCVPEGGYLPDAEAYRMIAESLRIGGGRHPNASAEEIDAGMAQAGIRAEVERIRERGRAGEARRAQESIPPAFRAR